MFLSMVLVYLGIGLFFYLTLKNKKPINWSKFFDAISFRSNINDDIYNIPGPVRLPFLGTTWVKYFRKEDKLHEYYEDLNKKYGDIVLETFGNVNIVSVFKQQDIEKVLGMTARYPFRPPVEITVKYRSSRPDRYASAGLTNSNGKDWSELRSKMTSKTFENRKKLSQFFPSQIDICNDFVSKIKECRNENNIIGNVDDILRLFAFESSSSFIIGKRMGAFGNHKSPMAEKALKLAEATRQLFSIFSKSYYGNQLWKKFPTKLYRDYVKTEETCYEIVQELINEIIEEGIEDDGSPLSTILLAKELKDQEKIAAVVDFFVAGTDVLQSALLILVNYISDNPECQIKICEESKHLSDEISLDDISDLHYTRAVIMEAFRMCPSAFALARIAENEIDLSGYHLKEQTLILNHTSIACLKEENFDDAKSFKPERWIDEEGKYNPTSVKGNPICLPFGIGKRRCPGEKYAEYFVLFFLVKLAQSFEVKVMGEMEKVFEFILRAKTPVDIEFRDRIESY